MNFNISLSLFTALLFFTTAAGNAVETDVVDKATGKTFPETVSFDYFGKKYTLHATGVATRKKFFVKVYSVASYIEDPTALKTGDIYANILNSDKTKQLSLSFVRDVPQDKLVKAYQESFSKVTSKNKDEINKFLSFIGDVKNGDMEILRWLPDGTIIVLLNNTEKGTIQNKEFARSLWSIWFEKTDVVNRENLVKLIQ